MRVRGIVREPGRAGALWLIRGGERTALGSKVNNLRLWRGDTIRLETSGGGGFGPAEQRSAAAQAMDRQLGYIAA